ncbi:MAG TPA: hypothetical protein VHM30_11810 [Gemmatimonadaceae bacterium]|nr:hypothetical protein [Gemmatimonadaceae bacterium]
MRIGLAVASDAVRIVCVRDGRILWAGESPLLDDLPLEASVGRLLEAAALPRWPRPATVVAVGPARAQVKRLAGLPPVADARALSRIVAENAGRFFLRNGAPLATTAVMAGAGRDGWGSAIEAPLVNDVAALCRRKGLRLVGITPSVAVLRAGLRTERVVWPDGEIAAEVAWRDGSLFDVRRVPAEDAHGAAVPDVAAELAGLGTEAWRFADAYGAAVARAKSALMLRPNGHSAIEPAPVPGWRMMLAASALAIALAVFAFAPLVAAANASRAAMRTIASLATERGRAARAEADLRRVTAALNEAAAFDHRRRSPLAVLADLTQGLPESAHLVSVRMDSAGGTIVALALRGADVVAALEAMPAAVAPEIVGPVTRESVAGREKERVTVRFRWAAVEGAQR